MNFKVIPSGLVQGGTASYVLDPTNGVISYNAFIKVGKWFISKTYQFQGTYTVDKALLDSSNVSVGKVIIVGDLNMKIVNVMPTSALVSLSINGQSATGTATLLTSLPQVQLQSVDAIITVLGMQLSLAIRPA